MHTRLIALFIGLALLPFFWAPRSSAQISIIPGNSVRGAELFQKKACVQCHAFNGVGGKVAPDLAQQNESVHTPAQLASVLWNHAPRMWRAQQDRQVQPVLDSVETSDLFAYFYSLSYSKAPGNAVRGAQVFQEKRCATCHESTVEDGISGSILGRRKNSELRIFPPSQNTSRNSVLPLQSPISTWADVNDPLIWAERMWNHSAKVYAELSNTGVEWPRFSGMEMVDLLTYLRSLPQARSESAVFQPGDPGQGRITFERNCETCHSFGDRTATPKIDLLKRPAPAALTDYVAAMWNHAPAMHSRAGNQFPILAPGDMNGLVAYLFAQRYFDAEGNVQRGARVFEVKQCVVCHEQRRKETGAPDLTLAMERYSPITFSAAVWQHGPAMFKTVQQQKLAWPELKASEVSDLISFLNSRLVARVARPD